VPIFGLTPSVKVIGPPASKTLRDNSMASISFSPILQLVPKASPVKLSDNSESENPDGVPIILAVIVVDGVRDNVPTAQLTGVLDNRIMPAFISASDATLRKRSIEVRKSTLLFELVMSMRVSTAISLALTAP
jgi:hypothetical protein